jgi:2-oxo-4-hydroxy-4-carboxy-5-ureidoimidazoline decarboxylase
MNVLTERADPMTGLSLAEVNAAPDGPRLRDALRACCAADSWVARLVADRPYADRASLFAVSDAATAALDEQGLAQALAGHPRIGERVANHTGAWSQQEQSGVTRANAGVRAELAAANAAYEERFGHVYLVAATGKDAEELLAIARSRLTNDRVTERGVVLAELAKINRLRLAKLLHEEN